MPTAPYDERSSGHIKLVIMETSLIEWHGKWPGASREETEWSHAIQTASLSAYLKPRIWNWL